MNIKQLRVLRGLKQKELADKMGISAQQLNNYEGGAEQPRQQDSARAGGRAGRFDSLPSWRRPAAGCL
ncbi:MAG: helix-turn-helix transcriptional regulator [Oscillospiraceae bacterium]